MYRLDSQRFIILLLAVAIITLAVRGCISAKFQEDDDEPELLPESALITVWCESAGEKAELMLESYLVGVVAAEMPASYSPEALKAQAVAARTFLARRMSAGGCKKHGTDICTNSGCCQAWRSDENLKARWQGSYDFYIEKIRNAVYSTRGEIMTCDGVPIEALYHACSGGQTESSEHVFAVARSYLVGVESKGEESSKSFTSTKDMELKKFVSLLNSKFKKAKLTVKNVSSQIRLDRYESGRIKTAYIGGATVTGKQLRSALGAKSTNIKLYFSGNIVTITTYGYGHGVGMSQVGANELAKSGEDYKSILAHYYSNIELDNLDNLNCPEITDCIIIGSEN